MRHSNEYPVRLSKSTADNNAECLSNTFSGDESTEVSSEEQSDILDFFVKDGTCDPADLSVINLSDDDDITVIQGIPASHSNHLCESISKDSKCITTTNATGGVVRKRGRPPKNVTKSGKGCDESKSKPSDSKYFDSNLLGRTKASYKPGLQSMIITPQRSLNCAIKFGEPVGIVGMEKKLKMVNDQKSDMAILNRPKRFATQKQNNSCSTDEETFNITWQEMRDLEKALAASLKRKDSSTLDLNSASNALAQRKFSVVDEKPENVPKKRGRKRKEPINLMFAEKAYTEDFINFLCTRSSSVKQSLPTSQDLFTNCIGHRKLPSQSKHKEVVMSHGIGVDRVILFESKSQEDAVCL